jgi:hypothetical protein
MFTVNPPPNPLPTLSSIAPFGATVGGAAFTLTVTGANFIASSQILWNGNAVDTTYVSAMSLTASIAASNLASSGVANVRVQNPAPGGGTSAALKFKVSAPAAYLSVVDLEGTDIAWNASTKQLYVAVPSVATNDPSTIAVVDPVTASIVNTKSLSTAPTGLAISDDDSMLYAVVNDGAEIQRFTLPALSADIIWTLGTDPFFNMPNLAGGIAVRPGSPNTLAVAFGAYGDAYVGIYDNDTKRSRVGGSVGEPMGDSLCWNASGTTLYAAYGIVTTSPYYTSSSDLALSANTISSSGIGSTTYYHSSFQAETAHLECDPKRGYVLDDWGETIKASTGIPVGNYRLSRPSTTFLPGSVSAIDSDLKRYYYVIPSMTSTPSFHLQVFDSTDFHLISGISIPNGVGIPVKMLRWGASGLAFITNTGLGSAAGGKLYILNGAFVNPAGTADTSTGAQVDSVPVLNAVSPLTAAVGSDAITITLTGHDFGPNATAYWNGAALASTPISSTELSAMVPASDLTSAAQASIWVSNSGNASSASNTLPFAINPALPSGNQLAIYNTGGGDLRWDANASKLYVSMPGIQGDAGDAIAIVDPVTGNVSNTGFLGSDPGKIAISSDSNYLYAALDGQNEVRQLNLPDLAVRNRWNLGLDPFFGPYFTLDLKAAPGAPHTTAVTFGAFEVSPPSAGLAIFDDASQRGTRLPPFPDDYTSLQWAEDDATLFSTNESSPQSFMVVSVSSVGPSLAKHYDGLLYPYSPSLEYDGGAGLLYAGSGQVIKPADGTIAGTFASSGLVVPDSTLGKVFILGQTDSQFGTANYTLNSYDQTNYTAIDSLTIPNIVGTPTALVRWGTNGLAFTSLVGDHAFFYHQGPGQLYVISGDFVKASGTSTDSVRRIVAPVHWTSKTRPASRTRSSKLQLEHIRK